MQSIPAVNILPTPTVTPSANAATSNANQSANDADATGAPTGSTPAANAANGTTADQGAQSAQGTQGSQGTQSSQGSQGAFGNILAKQIAAAVAQIIKSSEAGTNVNADATADANAKIDALIANAKDVPAIDPDALLKQINIDINQLAGADKPDAGAIDKSLDKLLAADPALAGILKKAKKSAADEVAGLDKSQTAAPVIAVGNLPPTLAATTDVTGKDLPKDIGISTQVPTAAVKPEIPVDPASAKDDKALNAFVNELTTKLAEANTDQTPTQQTPLNAISSAATVNNINNNRADVVTPPVGSQTWDSALGEKVVWIVGTQTQNAELHLNPPSLGPLEIRVSLTDGQANVSFMTQHAAVREAIEAATPKLREMMGDSGINMGSVSVNVGTFSQQQQDQAAQQQQAANNRNNNASNNDFSFGTTSADTAPVETVTTTVRPLRDLGMVDLFA
ncbi:MAG TPA: flagellar hook-length control protein FliK [Methylophilaceae bacterium]